MYLMPAPWPGLLLPPAVYVGDRPDGLAAY